MTTSRSAIVRASSWSCVTMTVVSPSFSLQFADLDAHLLPQLGIEVGQRLVEQQHVGAEDERTRQRHPLLLAAGELARQPLAQMLEADEPQGLGDAAGHLRGLDLAHLQPEGDVLRHRQMREERVALKHQAGVALPGRQSRDVAIAETHRPRARLDEARHDAQRRRLAAAGRAEQHHELPVGDVESDVADGVDIAVALGDAIDLEPCHRHTTRLILTKRSVISMTVAISKICRTETAAMVGSIFHSRYWMMAIGKVVRPGPTRNRLISRLPNEDTKPNSAAATTPGRMAGRVTLRKRRQAVGAEALGGLLDRSVETGEAGRHQPHRPWDDDQHMAGDQPAERAEDRQSGVEFDLDVEHVERDAQHDARHHQRQQQQAAQSLAAPEAQPRDAERRRQAEAKADAGRDHRKLQAEQKAGDEAVVAGNGPEPPQRIAFRRKRRDLLAEEGEPGDEDQRRQDIGERDRRPAVEGHTAEQT